MQKDLEHGFPNSSMHKDHVESLLKHKLLWLSQGCQLKKAQSDPPNLHSQPRSQVMLIVIPLIPRLGKHSLSSPDNSLANETKPVHFKYTLKIYLACLDDQVDLTVHLCRSLACVLANPEGPWKGLREKLDKLYWGRIGINLNAKELWEGLVQDR